jgi:hypothetical protein
MCVKKINVTGTPEKRLRKIPEKLTYSYKKAILLGYGVVSLRRRLGGGTTKRSGFAYDPGTLRASDGFRANLPSFFFGRAGTKRSLRFFKIFGKFPVAVKFTV